MEIADVQSWQLGQYMVAAVRQALSKSSNIYPQNPLFAASKVDKPTDGQLTKEQEELETLKFKDFFSNLGQNVAIKKKGGSNGK